MAQPLWWKHAVLYEIDIRTFASSTPNTASANGDLKGAAARMAYVKSLGVDAILLDPLQPASQPEPIDPALGTPDDFDLLAQQASRQGLRLLVTLTKPDPALARFWLSRGVAGFYLASKTAAPADVQALRKLLASYVGGRILITDADLPAPTRGELLHYAATPAPTAATLPELTAALRTELEQMQTVLKSGTPLLATPNLSAVISIDQPPPAVISTDQRERRDPRIPSEAAKSLGTILLLHRGAALIHQGEELATTASGTIPWGPDPPAAPNPDDPEPPPAHKVPERNPAANNDKYVPYVRVLKPVVGAPVATPAADPTSAAAQAADPASALNFYKKLIALHHGNDAFKDSEELFLNHDDARALVWIRRPPNASYRNPAIVIVCNLSGNPLSISLKDDIARLHLRGNFLRKILRSDGGLGSTGIDPIALPAYGVYIGELKY